MLEKRVNNLQISVTKLQKEVGMLRERFRGINVSQPVFERDISLDISMKLSKNKTHCAVVDDNINDYCIGEPVFLSGNMYQLNDNDEYVKVNDNDKKECVCGVIRDKNSSYRLFLGICSAINEHNNTIEFINQGCYYFKVADTSTYNIGNTVLYNGEVIDDSKVFVTREIERQIIGIITGIIGKNYVTVFK